MLLNFKQMLGQFKFQLQSASVEMTVWYLLVYEILLNEGHYYKFPCIQSHIHTK